MRRKITEQLMEWKNKGADRLPLILHGARQVGKTYILEEFGSENYKHMVYVNFEQTPALRSLFEGDLSPEKIIRHLETYSGKPIIPGETLIVFDEVQTCERALTSLKYFAETANEFHIAAAGSLLGVALNRQQVSFPVGKVEMKIMYPFDFEEFLWAIGKAELANEIRKAFDTDTPLPGLFHDMALELYRTYLCVGGMPAAVAEYVRSGSLLNISKIHDDILNAYLADMAKYATAGETVKIRTAFDSIPAQLAKDNRKFQYKLLARGARSSHFGVAIDWLSYSGIVSLCRRIEHGRMPPSAYVDLSAFKLYMADTGLLVTKARVPAHTILLGTDDGSDFRGAITENNVAQALAANGYDLHYWESGGVAEVDFVIVRGGEVIPVEAKSFIHSKSKSLGVYVKRYASPYAIRVSARNFGLEGGIKSVPLYAVFAI